MIPDTVPNKDVYHAPEELRKEAHISSYDKYKDLYLRSTESPDGELLTHLPPLSITHLPPSVIPAGVGGGALTLLPP